MKHLVIILSILLLSPPVIGDNHKGETLYRWGEKSPYVWKGFGDKETHLKYIGDVQNGKPNGLGILTIPKFGDKYVGSWKDGKFDGQGTYTYSGSYEYVGGWKEGLMNGQSVVTFFDGGKYIGDWKDGNRWNGTRFDKNRKILWKYVNGKKGVDRTMPPPKTNQ